jgi:uncharacterized protein YbdZ (MbtH family)
MRRGKKEKDVKPSVWSRFLLFKLLSSSRSWAGMLTRPPDVDDDDDDRGLSLATCVKMQMLLLPLTLDVFRKSMRERGRLVVLFMASNERRFGMWDDMSWVLAGWHSFGREKGDRLCFNNRDTRKKRVKFFQKIGDFVYANE